MGFIHGGMGTIRQAIAASGRENGLEIRTDTGVLAIETLERAYDDSNTATGRAIRSLYR